MPKLLVNGIRMHYQSRGSGPELVLIHGITSNLAMWYNGFLTQLAAEFHVTAYDLRGHGLTDITASGYTSLDLAVDLRALLDTLGIGQAVIVGHSFGGTVGLHFALDNPDRVRGLVMMDSGVACLRYLRIIQDWWGWENRPDDMKENGLSLEQFLELDNQQDVTEIIRHGLSVPRRSGFKKGHSGLTSRQRKLLDETRLGYEFRDVAGLTEERLAGMRTPILCLYGEGSPYRTMASRLAELIPSVCDTVLPESGHFSAILKPNVILEHLLPFLREPCSFLTNITNIVKPAG